MKNLKIQKMQASRKEDVDRITKGEALIGRLKFRKGAGGLKKMELSNKVQ